MQFTNLPRAKVCNRPTPIERMTNLQTALNHPSIYIKRDDLTHPTYGGNKVRKLDFLLADAKQKGHKEIITFGYAGSNHCTATAVHAKQLGLKCTLVLLDQLPTKYLTANLMTSLAHEANYIYCKNTHQAYLKTAIYSLKSLLRHKKIPYQIPPGGSVPLGSLGFVEAIFELKTQIDAGQMPEPESIYVPCSSLGTVVGMAIGIQLTGLKTKVQAIKVVDEKYTNTKKLKELYQGTADLIRKLAPQSPPLDYQKAPLIMRREFFEGTYAKPSQNSQNAVEMALKHHEIKLENTYSAHALGALIADVKENKTNKGTLLLWNTFNSANLSIFAAKADVKRLPKGLQAYF